MDDDGGIWSVFWLELGGALLLACAAVIAVTVTLGLIGRRSRFAGDLLRRIRWPLGLTLPLASAAVVTSYMPDPTWRGVLGHALVIALIASGGWLVAGGFLAVVDHTVARSHQLSIESADERRMRTQLRILRRLGVVVIVVVTVGAILMTFEAVRAIGVSLLASAGIVSVVVGLAAQSMLANVFAGVQLAYSEAIRVGDVVVVEGQWGRIHDITLSYVVVVTWDRRVLVLPCTRFTSSPFENWSKISADLSGTVELDLDWRASIPALRKQLDGLLAGTALWDGDVVRIHLTDATGG